jgi:hypothetical protein
MGGKPSAFLDGWRKPNMKIQLRSSSVLAMALLVGLSACKGSSSPVLPSDSAPSLMQQQDGLTAVEPDKKFKAIVLYAGEIVGADNLFKPHSGDGPKGGHGKPAGGIPCSTTEYINNYHVHAYVGIIVDGKQVALPDAIGLKDPAPATDGFIDSAKCFYYIHTHDASGVVHVEVPQNLPYTATPYKFGDLLDVWGLSANKEHFGPFHGKIRIYVGNVPLKETLVTKYAPYTKTLRSIKLRSHEVIWIVIGKRPLRAAGLPPVTFYTEY